MQKKKKKGKSSSKHSKRKAVHLSAEQLENQAREDLANKRFKRARYGFSELRKLDGDKYSQELTESNFGLARNLLKKGRLQEADVVIANIKILTGDESEGVLDVWSAFKKRDDDTACRMLANLISEKENISILNKTPEVADVIVLAFEDFPQLNISCPGVHEDIAAIQHALENISAERFEDAWSWVKNISVNSIFSNWKMFIKGLTAFYSNDDAKAISAFNRISPDSLLQGVVRNYMILIDSLTIDTSTLKEVDLQKICVVAGHPDLTSILPRANYLWKVGRYRDSYWHVRDRFKSFPSENSGVAGILTRFYFNNILHLPEKSAKKYLSNLKNKIIKPSASANLEEVLVRRAECLLFNTVPIDDSKYVKIWEGFLNAYTAFYGNNNKLEALVYYHLGTIFSVEKLREPSFLFWEPPHKDVHNLRNAQLAEQYFDKSITLDKENKDASLELLRVYEKTKNKSKANKLLDKLVPAFPDDQIIMTKAGMECLERKAFIKGAKYLEQAIILDPLDRTIKEHLAIAYISTARNYYEKNKIKQGRDIFQKALNNGIADSSDLSRGHAYIYARWAALEFRSNNNGVGEEKFELSMKGTENHLTVLYFTQFIYKEYGTSGVYAEKVQTLIDREWKKPPVPAVAVSLIKIYSFVTLMNKVMWLAQEKRRVTRYALDAVGKPCSRDDALFIVNFDVAEGHETKLSKKYINKMLKEDKDDPQFLYLRYKLNRMKDFSAPPNKNDINKLNKILHIAEKRNEIGLIKELRKTIEEFNRMSEIPNIFGGRCTCGNCDDSLDLDFDDGAELEMFGDLIEEMLLLQGGGSKREKKRKR
jgi:tetratricopeptide (TPR) repeat protein